MGTKILDGLFIFVQVKGRERNDVRRDIRMIQTHGGVAVGYADNPRITHCLIALNSRPQPYFTRTFEEPISRLPQEFHEWTCDDLIYFFHFKIGNRCARVVQSEWLYDSLRAGKRLGPDDAWGGWRVQCEMGPPPALRERFKEIRSSAAEGYAGPVRDISKDPRLKGANPLKATTKGTYDTNQRISEDTKVGPSASHTARSQYPLNMDPSSEEEEEEPLRKRPSLRKRMVHSPSPSLHQSPRPSPPRSPALSIKTSPKSPSEIEIPQSPQSPRRLKGVNLNCPTGPRGTEPVTKPSAPVIRLNTRTDLGQSVQTPVSKCYVPRWAHANEASSQAATTARPSTTLADRFVRASSPSVSANPTVPLLQRPGSSESLNVNATAAVEKVSAAPAAPQTQAQSSAPVAPSAPEPSSSLLQAPLPAPATASKNIESTTAPAPPPDAESTTPPPPAVKIVTQAPIVAAPAAPVQQTKAAEPEVIATQLPTPVTPATELSSAPASVSPTPALPASVVAETTQQAAAPVQPSSHLPSPQQSPKPDVPAPESGLLAPGTPPVPFRIHLSEGLKPGTLRIVELGKALEVPLSEATYVIVPSRAAQRKLAGPVPPFACIVDEAWLLESFTEGELQNVRDYFVDLSTVPSRKRKASSLSLQQESATGTPRAKSRAKRPVAPLSSERSKRSELSDRNADRDPSEPRRSEPREPIEPEEDEELIEPEEEEDMQLDPADDSDDESYCASDADEDATATPANANVTPDDADIANVWWLIDELRQWDKKGQIRHQLERCSREGISNARKLYYRYKNFIEKHVPDLRVRKPYQKRARVV